MSDTTTLAVLPPRATVARLHLQVRQALHEAEAAEVRAATAALSDETAAMQRTVARLMDDGRAAFARSLDQARADAAAAIAAAHLRAAGLPAAAPATVAADAATMTSPVGGASRATVAMLALQVRAAEQAAVEAEERAALAEIAVVTDLRDHLASSIEARAVELATALDAARSDATSRIAAAHRQARVRHSQVGAAPIAPTTLERAAAPVIVAVTATNIATTEPTATAPAPVAAPVSAPAPSPGLSPVSPPLPAQMDPEVFATMFATVLANMLDDRLPAGGQSTPQPKPSFWAHARHPDVLLLGLATVIMLVLLAAWLA